MFVLAREEVAMGAGTGPEGGRSKIGPGSEGKPRAEEELIGGGAGGRRS